MLMFFIFSASALKTWNLWISAEKRQISETALFRAEYLWDFNPGNHISSALTGMECGILPAIFIRKKTLSECFHVKGNHTVHFLLTSWFLNVFRHLKLKGLQFEVENSKYQLDFGADGFVSNAAYKLLNLIETGSNDKREWREQGRFVRETLHLDTIIWPGGSPRLPHSFRSVDTHKIRLVLKESLPFVMVTEQFSKSPADEEKCMDVGLICLNATTSDPRTIQKMLNGQIYARRLCCFGFTVDLAKRIAKDLALSYVAFLTSEAMVGSKINGTWRGMVGDIAKGSADMAAGATSITPERMEVVDFTVPYYSSAFGTLSARKPPSPNLGAFLDPFSFPMWVLIFIFVHITAIFMAMFEWLSPYGLHPLGRNRAKTFSFPSGLLHTWSLLFSHTYNSKPPKSVASRIIVNAWGMFAVVFIAGYTANLASFMAGRMLDPNIDISKVWKLLNYLFLLVDVCSEIFILLKCF